MVQADRRRDGVGLGAGRYGPLDVTTTRQLLLETPVELRKVCRDATTGRVQQVADTVVRPTPGDPQALRDALVEMVTTPSPGRDDTPEPQHDPSDPSDPLARFVRIRDGACDGIGCSVPAARCELDHAQPWPDGPTAAWNLQGRSQRCHHAKHAGWTVLQHPDGTTEWISPSGRRYRIPSRDRPPPTMPPDAALRPAAEQATHDHALLTAPYDNLPWVGADDEAGQGDGPRQGDGPGQGDGPPF